MQIGKMKATNIKVSQDICDLIAIMAALRDPNTGCPWDIKQTCETIIPYTIEEVYEVVDAINRNDSVDLCEELGDLLLQVIYYTQICSEQNLFSFGDVVETITRKMIRRHPHVFGSDEDKKLGMQPGQWQRIKQQEKEEKNSKRQAANITPKENQSLLDEVLTVFPAPIEAIKLQSKAASVGFDWPHANDVIDKLNEEVTEIITAIDEQNISDIEAELGDIYFTLINLARKLEIDPEKALARTNKKFRQRFKHIEQRLQALNVTPESCPLDKMEEYWLEAKKL